MNYGELVSIVRETVNRGETIDQFLPGAIRRAGRHIEQVRDWKYMERWRRFTMKADATDPTVIEMPPDVKTIKDVAVVYFDKQLRVNRYIHLDRTKKEYVYSVGSTQRSNYYLPNFPYRYWIHNVRWIHLDRVPAEDLCVEVQYYEMTSWPAQLEGAENFTNWLLDNGEEYMIAATLYQLKVPLRLGELMTLNEPQMVQALNVLKSMDDQMKEADGVYELQDPRIGREDEYRPYATPGRDWKY